MNLPFLTQQSGILGPFAWIMGIILNTIYEFFSLFGIHNIAICIVLFTFVIKMLMLPLTIKQQKFTRLSSKMNPEITKIQNKYKGKNTKDPEIARRQQAEMQEVYGKYGTSPMGGCLPMLITLPILFALYRVVYVVPAYVYDIKDMYQVIADKVVDIPEYIELIRDNFTVAVKNFELGNTTHLIDVFSKFTQNDWNKFFNIETFGAIKDAAISFNGTGMLISDIVAKIINVNGFLFGMNILENAGWNFPGIIIPAMSMSLYFVQNKLLMTNNKGNDVDNPASQSMKTMTNVMPVISGVFCVFMPIALGIYWISSSLFQIIQQIFINKYLDKVDINDMIEKNIEKSNKNKKKYGIDTGNKMASVAKTTTKAIESSSPVASTKKKPTESSNYKKSNVSYSAGSISANANLLNNRNKEKGDKE